MADTMIALGDFRFALSTAAYQELERTLSVRWAKQDRLGRAPAYQFVGEGESRVTLTGVVFPHFAGGLEQVERMRDIARLGEPLSLVDGLGNVWGQHVITEVREGQKRIDGQGVPWRQDFTLTLQAYGEDA